LPERVLNVLKNQLLERQYPARRGYAQFSNFVSGAKISENPIL
jgi:hypothetical protein